MTRKPPVDPLIVIIGATGTGKSQLAVDLATKYNGEVINGDAMQMYDGLPIITNKVTLQEQNGVPHHLLGVVGLEEEPWRVGVFKKRAGQVIREIRARGRIPILVGGTHYYTQVLLFNENLVSESVEEETEIEDSMSRVEIEKRFPILAGPTEEILQKLSEVDPMMASRWHPNDRRRVQRSLEIYLMTGKQASKVYEEQKERKACQQRNTENEMAMGKHPSLLQSTLIFWVHADRELLKSRLDKRVDKMISSGLIDEVNFLDDFLEKQIVTGVTVDRTSGIWVSIGFKEFEPYITAKKRSVSIVDTETALANAIERTKVATRQYAKRQLQWIRNKLLNALSAAKALDSIYLLDGSDLSKWSQTVSDPALYILGRFLDGQEISSPTDMSPAAKELLIPKQDHDLSDRMDLWIREVCEMCDMTAVTEEQWQRHLKSRKHRRQLKNKYKNKNRVRAQEQDIEHSGLEGPRIAEVRGTQVKSYS